MIKIICGDCLDVLPSLGQFDCIFLDPPDNLNLKYDNVDDCRSPDVYVTWLRQVLLSVRPHAPTIWLSFNANWMLQVSSIIRREYGGWHLKTCVQTFTFGQHNQHDFGNCHRPLWRLRRPDAPIYADKIRVPSWRQQNRDKRADPRGRVPGDVFDFPRVTGNSKQRRNYHPTQLHEGLVERCIRSATPLGGSVLDPLAGTGTVGRVCQRIGRECTLIEISPYYCEQIRQDLL